MIQNKFLSGFLPIERQINQILKPTFAKKKDNFLFIKNLSQNWQQIIGEKCYKFCAPKKVQFERGKKGNGALYIKAYNSAIAFYLEANSSQIIENIASYYGYKIIDKIRIVQELGNIQNDQNIIVKQPEISSEALDLIAKSVANIKDEELKNILQKLGISVLNKNHTQL